LTRHPIHRALLTLQKCNVRHLVMGGQACILYGAAEFSRDLDVAILAGAENIDALRAALAELEAEQIFLPPLEISYLDRGHACHFRCHHAEANGLRLDVMSRMRGCDPFPLLWERRTILDLAGLDLQGIEGVPLLSLRDLVQCKKTQRDKDWSMLRRLVEIEYLAARGHVPPPAGGGAAGQPDAPTEGDALWWLAELRSPPYLEEVAKAFPGGVGRIPSRPWLRDALSKGPDAVETCLRDEEFRIREEDRAYWRPLREELERMRRAR